MQDINKNLLRMILSVLVSAQSQLSAVRRTRPEQSARQTVPQYPVHPASPAEYHLPDPHQSLPTPLPRIHFGPTGYPVLRAYPMLPSHFEAAVGYPMPGPPAYQVPAGYLPGPPGLMPTSHFWPPVDTGPSYPMIPQDRFIDEPNRVQEEVPASSSSTCQPSFVRNFGLATSPTGPANSRSVFTLPTRSNKNSSSNSTDVVAPNTTKKAGKATSSSSSTQTPVATPGSIKVPKATRQRWQQWQRDLTVPRSYRMINTLNVPPVNNPAQKPKVLTPSELVCVSPNASSVPKEVFGNDAPRFTWIHVYVPYKEPERKTVDTPNVPSQAASSSSGAAVIGNPAEEKPAPSASTRQVMKKSSFPEKGEEIPLSLINHYSQMRWKTDEEIWTPSERKAPNIAGVQPLQPSHSTWVIAVEKIGGSWYTI